MATAGSIVVNLIANTKSFQQGLRRSKMSLEDMKRSVKSSQDAINAVGKEMTGMFLKAVGTAASAIAILTQRNADLADSYVVAGDAIIKYASSIGVAVEELQGLQYAAEQMGSSSESLSRSLIRMIANIGDAANGVGLAKGSFQRLNLEASELIQLSPDKSFLAIADAIKDMKNPTEAAAMAYRIFGRNGMEMVNMLRLGTDGIAEFRKEAEAIGAVMSHGVQDGIAKAKGQIDKFEAAQKGFQHSKGAAFGGFNPLRSVKEWWYTVGPTRRFYEMINDETGTYAELERKAAQAGIEMANAETRKANSLKKTMDYQKKIKAGQAEIFRSEYVRDLPGRIERDMAEIEEADLMRRLTDWDAFEKAMERGRPLFSNFGGGDLLPPEPFHPGAREIDSSRVSVSGLAMSGQSTVLTETKKSNDYLREIADYTRRTANQEVLN